MSKRGEIKNISTVINDVLSQKHFKIGIDNLRVQEAWNEAMGKNINKYISNIKFRNGKLSIKIKSSVLKEEFKFEKVRVIELLNKKLGKIYIKDIDIS
tara:strand:- start:410 stop:703 length:294 start_codon:yes stop_codon:yes gene_type:complete